MTYYIDALFDAESGDLNPVTSSVAEERAAEMRRRRRHAKAPFTPPTASVKRYSLRHTHAHKPPLLPWKIVKAELIDRVKATPTDPSNTSTIKVSKAFQLVAFFETPKASLKQVLYIPYSATQAMHSLQSAKTRGKKNDFTDESDFLTSTNDLKTQVDNQVVVTLDSSNVSVFRGSQKIFDIGTDIKIRTSQENNPIAPGLLEARMGVLGAEKLLLIEKYRVYVVFSKQLDLKILDFHFLQLARVPCFAPILSMVFVDSKDDLISGETGAIRVWKILRETNHHVETFQIQLKLSIQIFEFDDWIGFIAYDRMLERIIGTCEGTIYFFEYSTGNLIGTIKNAHKTSITCVAIHESLDCLISAEKSGAIKVWNAQNSLLHCFEHHSRPVTALVLQQAQLVYALEDGREATEKQNSTQPGVIFSGSLDGTIRIWDIDQGVCMHRIDTGIPVSAITSTKDDMLLVNSSKTVQLWDMKREFTPFCFTTSRPMSLRRYERPSSGPARLLAGFEDGSLRLINPWTAETLAMGFPIFKNVVPADIEYDTEAEQVYVRNSNNEFVIYNARTNPMKVIDVWKNRPRWDEITCVVGLSFVADDNSAKNEELAKIIQGLKGKTFHLIAGTTEGQILYLHPETNDKTLANGPQDMIVQAHSSKVVAICYDSINLLLVSAGRGTNTPLQSLLIESLDCFKVWKISAKHLNPAKIVTESTSPILLECTAIVSLQTHDSVLSLDAKTFAINPVSKFFAIAIEGKVKPVSYAEDVPNLTYGRLQIWKEKFKYGILQETLSGKLEVAVFSSHIAYRELLFNQTVSCIQFVNNRGDLIVGLSNQVAVVFMQNYLSIPLMKLALAKSSNESELKQNNSPSSNGIEDVEIEIIDDLNGFRDDTAENPLPFDSNSDFWDLFYNEQKELHGNIRWHVPKNYLIDDALLQLHGRSGNLRDNEVALFKHTESSIDEILRRRNRRIFLEKQANAFKHSEKFEEVFLATKQNPIHNGSAIGDVDRHGDEDEFEFDADYAVLHRSPSFTDIDVGMDISTPKHERLHVPADSPWKTVQATFSYGIRWGPIIQAAQKREKELKNWKNPLQNPLPPKKAGLKNIAEKREKILENFRKHGVNVPNSANFQKSVLKIASNLAKVSSAIHTDSKDQSAKNEKGAMVFQRRKKDPKSPLVHERLYGALIGNEFAESSFNFSNSESRSILSVNEIMDYSTEPRKESILIQPVDHQPPKLPPRVVAPDRAPSPKLETLQPSEPVKERDDGGKREAKTELAQVSAIVPTKPKNNENNENNDNNSAEVSDDDSATLAKKINNCNFENLPSVNQQFEGLQTSIPATIPSILQSWKSLGDMKTEEPPPLEYLSSYTEHDIQSYSWNLLKMVPVPEISESLRKVIRQFWIQNRMKPPINVPNLIKCLVQKLKIGTINEICEASKALYSVFKTFRKDIENPFEKIIIPHLEVLQSNNQWRLNAQLCLNVGAFGIRSNDVLHVLVNFLTDSNPLVQRCAKHSLMCFGIDTKDAFADLLKKLNILHDNSISAASSTASQLDEMAKSLADHGIALAAERVECVRAWQKSVANSSRPSSSHSRRRRSSYEEHLAGQFFKEPHSFISQNAPFPNVADDALVQWMENDGRVCYQGTKQVSKANGKILSGSCFEHAKPSARQSSAGSMREAIKMARPLSAGIRINSSALQKKQQSCFANGVGGYHVHGGFAAKKKRQTQTSLSQVSPYLEPWGF
ncbi:WD repeat-containing protein 87 [Entophlyctis luteolus]|nr:WD repeat-containing protein 87 [Entophlyctis luteolus]